MSTNVIDTVAGMAESAEGRAGRTFDLIKKLIVISGVAAGILLGTLLVVFGAGGQPTVFMWVRATILVVMTPMLSLLATRAEQGRAPSLRRLRLLVSVLPVTIVGVDLIPGVCPTWYAALQAVSALALIPVAFLTRRCEIRAAVPARS
jgi:hypothetical protein